jgi:predicted DNA-binding transcriptional regulator AlpA
MSEKNDSSQALSPRLLTVADITATCRFSKAHLYSMLKKQRFPEPAMRLGSRFVRWHASDVEAWAQNPLKWAEVQATQNEVTE